MNYDHENDKVSALVKGGDLNDRNPTPHPINELRKKIRTNREEELLANTKSPSEELYDAITRIKMHRSLYSFASFAFAFVATYLMIAGFLTHEIDQRNVVMTDVAFIGALFMWFGFFGSSKIVFGELCFFKLDCAKLQSERDYVREHNINLADFVREYPSTSDVVEDLQNR